MWPLIIPPIVFVLSLGFLMWFLSRKGTDLSLQSQLALGEYKSANRKFLFFFKEETGLRILERFLQRLKLMSLKFHNRFQQFSDVLKQKREQTAELKRQALENELSSAEHSNPENFWDRWHRRHRATLESSTETPSAPSAQDEATQTVLVTNLTSREPRPSRLSGLKKRVSALVTTDTSGPFSRTKHVTTPPRKLLSEEELIDRIAKNPKDAASYEELGDYYMGSDNLEDAKACYRQVIKLLPLNREVKDKVRKLERLLVQREKQRG